jgi:predicted membrane-bound spermidine synthase
MRNFYGVLSVYEYTDQTSPNSRYYLLQHGRITHGIQFAAPERAREITSYFGPGSGLGLALRNFPRQQNQRIGLLGLGVGTVTAYGKPGDYIRVYEINPQVKQIAEKPFSYLARSDAKIEVVMGDGRLSMENEPPQNFDVLIMDAFSSDAVPVHLLTKEAFEIYQRHLKPDGTILVNISNRYLDLRPVVENAADAFKLIGSYPVTATVVDHGTPNTYVIEDINDVIPGPTFYGLLVDGTGVTLTSTSDVQLRVAGVSA